MGSNINEELYRSVRLVVGDADQDFGRVLSSALFPIGLRDISICVDGQQLRDAIASAVDLVVCNAELPGIDIATLAQDIRHQRIAGNPFIVLIATANRIDEGTMARILQSGVDDLLVKPVDSATLVRRIGAFAKGRKPFVVTPGYIGPTRRNDRRDDGSDDDVVEVPNTIRAKVALRQSAAEIGRLIEAGRSSIGQKMASGGIQVIARLTRQIVEGQRDRSKAATARRALKQLATKAAEVAMLNRNSAAGATVTPIADSIARLSQRAESSTVDMPSLEIDLLSQLADAAQIANTAASSAPDAVPEIVAIVDGYLKRS